MSNYPLVSVVVPCYNIEHYVEECLDSIVFQSYQNIEILVINDGSTDATEEKIKKYLGDNRIKYIFQENKGLSAARNTGLNVMKGEYVCFVDSDDFLHRDYVKILYENLINTESDISACGFFKYHGHNEPTGLEKIGGSNDFEVKYSDECMELINGKGVSVVAWNKLFKSSIFDDLRFREGVIHEDEFIAHHLFFRIKKIVITNKVLYAYRQRENSIMSKKYDDFKFNCVMEAFGDRYKFYVKNNIKHCNAVLDVKWNYILTNLYAYDMEVIRKYIMNNPLEFFRQKKLSLYLKMVFYIKILLGLKIKRK